jgi:UDP-glucose 4-epimerase
MLLVGDVGAHFFENHALLHANFSLTHAATLVFREANLQKFIFKSSASIFGMTRRPHRI